MNKEKLLYERALITRVVMLFVCIVLKIFGVEWFNLDTSILLLNKIDEIVMNSEALSFLYSFIFTFISSYLVTMITLKHSNKRNVILVSLFVIISLIFKRYVNKYGIPFLIDTVLIYLIVFTDDKKCTKEFICCFILNISYQCISMFIRNLSIGISNHTCMTNILLNLDYYILLVITYLYLKKGDTTLCGTVAAFGSSLRTKLWKKHSQSSNPCSDKG